MYLPGPPGIVLIYLEARSLEEAHTMLSKLPLAGNSIIESELIELQPRPAIEILFGERGRR
jgi:hypothetical protein